MVWCGLCGKRYYPSLKGWTRGEKTYRYNVFRCRSAFDPAIPSCSNPIIREETLNDEVWKAVKATLLDKKKRDSLIKQYRQKKPTDYAEEIERLKKSIAKAERGIQRLLTTFRNVDESIMFQVQKEIYQAQDEREVMVKTLKSLQEKTLSFSTFRNELSRIEKGIANMTASISLATEEKKRDFYQLLSLRITRNPTGIVIDFWG